MHQEKIANVYQSDDYARFNKLLGNRAIAENRVKVIMESIQENGWIMNPIVVNEKYEIIDGQGRFTALRKLGKPIQYVVHVGATIKDCVALNLKQKNWSTEDYIRSYAAQGVEDYIRMVNTAEKHNLPMPMVVALYFKSLSDGGNIDRSVATGTFVARVEKQQLIDNNIEFIHLCRERVSKLHGFKASKLIPVLLFCYTAEGVNRHRVWDIVDCKLDLLPPLNTAPALLDAFSSLYNNSLRKNKHMAFDAIYKLNLLKGDN